MKSASWMDKIYFFFWELKYSIKHRRKNTQQIYQEMSDNEIIKLRNGVYDGLIQISQRHVYLLHDEINRRGL